MHEHVVVKTHTHIFTDPAVAMYTHMYSLNVYCNNVSKYHTTGTITITSQSSLGSMS